VSQRNTGRAFLTRVFGLGIGSRKAGRAGCFGSGGCGGRSEWSRCIEAATEDCTKVPKMARAASLHSSLPSKFRAIFEAQGLDEWVIPSARERPCRVLADGRPRRARDAERVARSSGCPRRGAGWHPRGEDANTARAEPPTQRRSVLFCGGQLNGSRRPLPPGAAGEGARELDRVWTWRSGMETFSRAANPCHSRRTTHECDA